MLTIGFDLDMTLVDTSKAIVFSVKKALNEIGHNSPSNLIESSIGLPMLETLESFLKNPEIARSVYERYQEIYFKEGFHLGTLLPGVEKTLKLLNQDGHKIVIITAKREKLALRQLSFCNLPYDILKAGCFGKMKSKAMLECSVEVYVGDHLEDFRAAEDVGVLFVGVSSNRFSRLEELLDSNVLLIDDMRKLIPLVAKLAKG